MVKLSSGAIAGIVIGCCVAVFLIVFIATGGFNLWTRNLAEPEEEPVSDKVEAEYIDPEVAVLFNTSIELSKDGTTTASAMSSNGRYVITVSDTGDAFAYDLSNGAPSAVFVSSILLSPSVLNLLFSAVL